MKKIIHFLLFLTLLVAGKFSYAEDFTAISPSGHRLNYIYMNARNRTVAVIGGANTLSGDVIIPSSITAGSITYTVTAIYSSAFMNNSGLTSVTIPNSVTSIGDYAFSGCSGLTSVTIPNNVTSIGNYAFGYCSSLTSITIPNSVTSIGVHAFDGCSGLTSVIIPDSVTSIGDYAFSGCSGLTSVIIPDSVTSIGVCAFSGCSGLTSVTIPNSVTYIGDYAFGSVCNVIYNGSSYGSPWGARTINGYERDGLVYSDNTMTTLIACSINLTTVTIPSSVISIGDDAFINCSDITSVTIPNSVTSIGDGAFARCSSLTSITIPNSVTSIGGQAFCLCIGLTSVIIPNCITSIGSGVFSGCSSLTSITIPNSVTSIGDQAFARCSSLTSITIPNSVTSIGFYAFSNCSGLTAITLSDSLTSISSSMFSGCTNLRSIVIPDAVSSIENGAFSGCTNLETVTIGKAVTSIDLYAFVNCNNLRTLYYNAANYTFTDRQGPFSNLPIQNLYIGSDVRFIPDRCFENVQSLIRVYFNDGLIGIGNNAFAGCTSLGYPITIPNSVTSIGDAAFMGCSSLRSIVLPSGIDKIPIRCFLNCSSLNSITIPEGVTRILQEAFYGCENLRTVRLSSNLTLIGPSAFSGCTSLMSITIPSNVTTIAADAFAAIVPERIVFECSTPPSSGGSPFYNATINTTIATVPCGCLQAYQNSDYYNFRNIVEHCRNYTLSLTANPTGAGTFSGMGTYLENTNVSIVAIQNSGYRFVRWSDGSTENPRTIRMNDDISLTAFFEQYNDNATLYTVALIPHPSNIGTVSGGGTYEENTDVTIMATPNAGYCFIRWSDGNTENPRTITVNNDISLTAYFGQNNEELYSVELIAGSSNMGTVSGGGAYVENADVTITATPNAGYRFVGWMHDGYIDGCNPCTFQVTSDITLIANFEEDINIVTLSVEPPDAGRVTGGGAYADDEDITISAIPNEGYRFVGWRVDGYDVDCNPCTFSLVEENITLVAIFEQISTTNYTVSLSASPSNMGSVSGGGTYTAGSSVTITASPYSGYRFLRWSDGNTENPRIITVNNNLSLTAYFEQISTTNYTVSLSAIPSNMGAVSGGGTYTAGSSATIIASPYSGYRFVRWSDGSTENPRIITVNNNLSLTAYFEQISTTNYTVTLSANPSNMGVVSGGGTYTAGSYATITASPYSGYRFIRWSDGSTDNPRTITVNNDISLVAYFEQTGTSTDVYYTVTLSASPSYMGTVSGGGTYRAGEDVTISATPASQEYYFSRWSDGNTSNPRTIYNLSSDLSLTAYFNSPSGIENISDSHVTAFAQGRHIIVMGAKNMSVAFYDMQGRQLETKQSRNDQPLRFDAPATGIYMIKVGNLPAQRVAILR